MDQLQRGAYYAFTTPTKIVEGRYINDDEDALYVKLESGYNIGIDKDRIEETQFLKSPPTTPDENKPGQNEDLPLVHFKHTGGTIASKVDYTTGGVSDAFSPAELLQRFPELNDLVHVKSDLIANMSSENMRFHHFNKITDNVHKTIQEEQPHAVIIGIGTDMMHYAAAALSFILENPPCPIILVGAQRSSDRPSTDAANNVLAATHYALSEPPTNEVVVAMHGDIQRNEAYIHRGVNARKMHTSRRDAFKSINATPLATVSFEDFNVTHHESPHQTTGTFTLHPIDETLNVGVIPIHPNMSAEDFTRHAQKDAVILQGTGLGHAPIKSFDAATKTHGDIKDAIRLLTEKMPVIMTSQCISGRVNLNVYGPGRELKRLGVLGHQHNETPETAYIKTAWLLSHYEKETMQELYDANLRGEHTPNTSIQEYQNTHDA